MDKIVISVLLTIVVGGAAVGGIMFLGAKGGAGDPEAVAQIQADLQTTREAVKELKADVKRLTSMQTELANALSVRPAAVGVPAAASGEEGEAAAVIEPGLRSQVFALIAEERTIREEERQKQRAEAEKQREERRAEMEELSQGPYDRLNLKVNSMARALGLDDTQRDKYAEITQKYRDRIDEERRALFAQLAPRRQDGQAQGEGQQPGAQPGGQPGERPGGRGFGRENFDKLRELATAAQNDYLTEVQGILTAPQVATFNELSESSQSFMSTGMTVKAGEDEGGPGGRMGDFMRGMMGGDRQRGPGARGRG